MDRKDNESLTEKEFVRAAFGQVGLEISDEDFRRLLPHLRTIRENVAWLTEVDLSVAEPQARFDPRWRS